MDENQTAKLIHDTLSGRMGRRKVLRRAAALGLSVPAISAILAACGGDDDGATATTAGGTTGGQTGGAATPTTGGGGTTAGSPRPGSPTTGGPENVFEIEEPKKKGGILVEGSFADARNVNPVLQNDTASEDVNLLIYNRTIAIDPNSLEPIPELATAWEISDDGTVYTMTLREGVKWHDGESFSADDIKFTYDLHMNPATKSPRTSELTERVKSVEVVNPMTIKFTLNFAVASFMASNLIYGIVPQHVLQGVAPAELAQHPFSTGQKGVTIGTGPFMFEEWVKDDHVTLVKFTDYWQGEPNLDQYIYRIVEDENVLAQQLKRGDIHYSGNNGVQPSSVEDLSSDDNLEGAEYDDFGFTFYTYQLDPTKSTLFQEKEVRHALLYALDREAMVEAIWFGHAHVAIGTMPPPSWAYAPDEIELKFEYDPDKAKQLLDQAGWMPGPDGVRQKNGQRLSFRCYTNAGNSVREQYIAIFQQQWQRIGVECTPTTEEWNALLERITSTYDFEMVLVGFSWDTDPDQSSMWSTEAYGGGFNLNKYSNPRVDTILKDALATTDQDERKELYIELQNILMEDLPSAILDFPTRNAFYSKRVHNLFPNAVDEKLNAHQWWME